MQICKRSELRTRSSRLLSKAARAAFSLLIILCFACAMTAFAFAEGPSSFDDVSPTSWFSDSVSYASKQGIAFGDNGKFRPNDPVTRGEFVTMLARMMLTEGYPEQLPDMPFEDVSEKRFYAKAVLWAYATGITSGTSSTQFSPNDNILRQEMAAMISRAERLSELGELPFVSEAVTFQDEDAISAYAKDAIRQLQMQGVLRGDSSGRVNPKGNLTRAEAATVLMRIHMYLSDHSHSYVEGELTVPSCTEGVLQYYCCDCGSYYAKKIVDALGHSYVKAEKLAPTCTEAGIQYYRCACGSEYTEQEEAALGHDYQSSDSGAGTVSYTCSRCADQYSESILPQKFYDGNTLHTSGEILSIIDRLQATYPSLISSYTGGYSVNGADIRVVKLGRGSRYIFMNGNLHGNEAVTTNYLLKVLEEYAYAYITDGTIGSYRIKPLLDTFTIVMIPSSNPDGRASLLNGGIGRNNARGVNLNANFPTGWTSTTESGAYAASEPETRAIIAVLSSYPFEVVLDCHNSGEVIYYADTACSQALINRSYSLAYALFLESGYGMLQYNATPGLANYARHPYGVPGLTVEMYPGVDTGHNCDKFSEWCWPKVKTMPAIVMTFLQK